MKIKSLIIVLFVIGGLGLQPSKLLAEETHDEPGKPETALSGMPQTNPSTGGEKRVGRLNALDHAISQSVGTVLPALVRKNALRSADQTAGNANGLKKPSIIYYLDGTTQDYENNLLLWQDAVSITSPNAPERSVYPTALTPRIEFAYENGQMVRAEMTLPRFQGWPRLERAVFDFKTMTLTAEIPTAAVTKSAIQSNNGEIDISFDSVQGERYLIQKRGDLSSSSWSMVGDIIQGNGKKIHYKEKMTGANGFYRVLKILPASVTFKLTRADGAPKTFAGLFEMPKVPGPFEMLFMDLGITAIEATYTDASGVLHHQTIEGGRVVKDTTPYQNTEFQYDPSGRLTTVVTKTTWSLDRVPVTIRTDIPTASGSASLDPSATPRFELGNLFPETEYSVTKQSGSAEDAKARSYSFPWISPQTSTGDPNLVTLVSWYNPLTFQHTSLNGLPVKTVFHENENGKWGPARFIDYFDEAGRLTRQETYNKGSLYWWTNYTWDSHGQLLRGEQFSNFWKGQIAVRFYESKGTKGIFYSARFVSRDSSEIAGTLEIDFGVQTAVFETPIGGRTTITGIRLSTSPPVDGQLDKPLASYFDYGLTYWLYGTILEG